MICDTETRLGRNGVDEIKAHPFFMEIDWDKLVRREIRPEFIPILDGEDDVRFFDDQFRKGFKQGAHNPGNK